MPGRQGDVPLPGLKDVPLRARISLPGERASESSPPFLRGKFHRRGTSLADFGARRG